MGLLDQARLDNQQIMADTNLFAIDIDFIAPNTDTITVKGFHTKHHLRVDPDNGMPVSAKTAKITVNETQFVNYPYRNSQGEVSFAGHLVNVPDSTGEVKNYTAKSWLPDETLGMIVIILEDYQT